MLGLVTILRNEWINMESGELPSTTQIDQFEGTYINVHSYISSTLSAEVYSKDRSYCKCLGDNFIEILKI